MTALRLDRLERRYRRWLLACPAEYRRERGDELVATLLDLAGPNRTRPGFHRSPPTGRPSNTSSMA